MTGPFEGLTEISPRLCRGSFNLDQADAITVTYKYSPARFLKGIGATIDGIHSSLAHAGKFLILGGVDNQEVFDEAESSSAVAAYVKWKLDE